MLDHKRSNAINIAMTKLPPPRAIKAAILKMDSTVVPREGIEKLLNMLPTDEERGKIQEAQVNNPELPRKFLFDLSTRYILFKFYYVDINERSSKKY